jgi:hypothetical protein
MKVRNLCASALVAIILSTFALPAHAQEPVEENVRYIFAPEKAVPKVDCSPGMIPAGYDVLRDVAVAPLLPLIATADAETVKLFLLRSLEPEQLSLRQRQILASMTDAQRLEVELGRRAFRKAQTIYLFTREGTPETEVADEPPPSFLEAQSEIYKNGELEKVVIPCGDIINGNSWGSRIVQKNGNMAIKVRVRNKPQVIGVSTPGALTADGRPGLYAWKLKGEKCVPITDDQSPYNGQCVSTYFLVDCGNANFDLKFQQYTEAVAPKPETPTPPQTQTPIADTVASKPVTAEPPDDQFNQNEGGGWPKWACRTKTSGTLCAIGAVLAIWRPWQHDGPATPVQPSIVIKTGGPGSRD